MTGSHELLVMATRQFIWLHIAMSLEMRIRWERPTDFVSLSVHLAVALLAATMVACVQANAGPPGADGGMFSPDGQTEPDGSAVQGADRRGGEVLAMSAGDAPVTPNAVPDAGVQIEDGSPPTAATDAGPCGTAAPAGFGTDCGTCGGTIRCDGTCSRPMAPDCGGKACGADDGCGGRCNAGFCPLHQSCGGSGLAGQCGGCPETVVRIDNTNRAHHICAKTGAADNNPIFCDFSLPDGTLGQVVNFEAGEHGEFVGICQHMFWTDLVFICSNSNRWIVLGEPTCDTDATSCLSKNDNQLGVRCGSSVH